MRREPEPAGLPLASLHLLRGWPVRGLSRQQLVFLNDVHVVKELVTAVFRLGSLQIGKGLLVGVVGIGFCQGLAHRVGGMLPAIERRVPRRDHRGLVHLPAGVCVG